MSRTPAPDFLVIGAAKSGTTSLRRYLRQHPQIFMAPRGEPSFFAHEGQRLDFRGPRDDQWSFVTDWPTYRDLFAGAPASAVRGEVSPRYLYFEQTVDRIKRHVPGAKLIAILRHPVDRAYSHFLMNRGRDAEPEPDFERALTLEQQRRALGWGWDWSYVGAGLYHRQLLRYVEAFPREQLKIVLYDDWRSGDRDLIGELFAFLDVDSAFRPDMDARARTAALPRSRTLHELLAERSALKRTLRRLIPARAVARWKQTVMSWNSVPPPPLGDLDRQRLFARYFADDAERLAQLIGRDLSAWWRLPAGTAA